MFVLHYTYNTVLPTIDQSSSDTVFFSFTLQVLKHHAKNINGEWTCCIYYVINRVGCCVTIFDTTTVKLPELDSFVTFHSAYSGS